MKATPSAEPFYGLDAGGVTSLEGGVAGLENIDPYSKSAAIGTQATIGAYSAKKIARAKAKKARSTTRQKVNAASAASAAIATTVITAITAASDADAVDDDKEGEEPKRIMPKSKPSPTRSRVASMRRTVDERIT